jgi:hypothetical protein
MVSLEFLIGTMAPGSTEPLGEIGISSTSWRPVLGADNLASFMCQLSGNLGASTSWNPHGLSRPIPGLLCLKVP